MSYIIPNFQEVLSDRAKALEGKLLQEQALKLKRLEEEKFERERYEKHVTSVLIKFVENTQKAVDEPMRLPKEIAVEVCSRLLQAGWHVKLKRVWKVTNWQERTEGGVDLFTIILYDPYSK